MDKKSLQDLIKEKQKNTSPDEKDQINKVSKDIDKFKNMSTEQLLAEMMNLKKTTGQIDDKKLKEFKEFVAPMLSNEQKSVLNSIINTLK